jgi:hypothetical protein
MEPAALAEHQMNSLKALIRLNDPHATQVALSCIQKTTEDVRRSPRNAFRFGGDERVAVDALAATGSTECNQALHDLAQATEQWRPLTAEESKVAGLATEDSRNSPQTPTGDLPPSLPSRVAERTNAAAPQPTRSKKVAAVKDAFTAPDQSPVSETTPTQRSATPTPMTPARPMRMPAKEKPTSGERRRPDILEIPRREDLPGTDKRLDVKATDNDRSATPTNSARLPQLLPPPPLPRKDKDVNDLPGITNAPGLGD